jgi:serine-type D-Ala-D-Ala endopeptidase (penicillin-binding protein 7)
MPLLPRAALAALALSAAFGLTLFIVWSLPGERPAEPVGDAGPAAAATSTAALGQPTAKVPDPTLAGPGVVRRPTAPPLNLGKPPAIRSDAALVVDEGGNPVLDKHSQAVKPIASITKLMTAVVVLDSGVDLDQFIEITPADRDNLRHSHSRMRTNAARLSRRDMLTIALMSSENRAASALGRTTFPDGTPAFVEAMNRKAQALGMTDTHYADASGLDGANRSTATDLVRLLQAANGYPLIREATTRSELDVRPYVGGGAVPYRNTNPLVRNGGWQVELSKTGYVDEAGHCLAMQAQIAGRRYWIVLLDSAGKRTPVGDSNRLRKWIESGRS